jgi:ABC-type thiamine transport system substrate-binding protein
MNFRRNEYLGMAQLFLLMGLLALFTEPACAQNPALIQAAKKEGEVVVFGSLENDVAAAIHKGFEAKHGIRTNYFRGSSTVMMDRITAEHRTGRMSLDVVFTTSEPMKFINREKGLFARYISPSAKDYDKKLIDDFFGPNYRSVIIGFVYNKSIIKPEDAPKSYEDIVNPKWKGKIAMGNPTLTTPPSTGSRVSIPSSVRRKGPMTGSSGSPLWSRSCSIPWSRWASASRREKCPSGSPT